MRSPAIILLVAATALSLPLSAQADPINGIYDSAFSGQILEGRWSESFVGGGHGTLGNTVHAASWDGFSLATQWELGDASSGPAIDAPPQMILNTVDGNGDGIITWFTTYSGGTLTLGAGAWTGLGDSPYAVTLTSYTHTTQYHYTGGVVQSASTIAQLAGSFDDYPNYEVSFIIAQALPAGEGTTLPANYPSWVPSDVASGHWGLTQQITMGIVPEPATLGLLGAGLLAVVARRRRK